MRVLTCPWDNGQTLQSDFNGGFSDGGVNTDVAVLKAGFKPSSHSLSGVFLGNFHLVCGRRLASWFGLGLCFSAVSAALGC